MDINLPQLISVEINLYDKGNGYPSTSIEITSMDDNSANVLLSFICDEQKKYPVKMISNKTNVEKIGDFINPDPSLTQIP